MSLSPSLVIRIVPDEGEAVDWTVHQNIVFRDVLVCKLMCTVRCQCERDGKLNKSMNFKL